MRSAWIVLCVAGLIAFGGWRLLAQDKPPAKADGKADDAQIKRGEYLANTIARCGTCHTPHNNKGELDIARNMQGATLSFAPKVKPKEWEDEAPDLTMSGKSGEWNEEAMVKFLTTGADSKGEKPDPPMPSYKMTADDAKAVTAYLRSLPGRKKEKKDDK
jgi:mono/diheme cytochrome c family protein